MLTCQQRPFGGSPLPSRHRKKGALLGSLTARQGRSFGCRARSTRQHHDSVLDRVGTNGKGPPGGGRPKLLGSESRDLSSRPPSRCHRGKRVGSSVRPSSRLRKRPPAVLPLELADHLCLRLCPAHTELRRAQRPGDGIAPGHGRSCSGVASRQQKGRAAPQRTPRRAEWLSEPAA